MDSLRQYSAKRNFDATPEPRSATDAAVPENRFVIHKHLARREHFDLRLQIGHLLTSWAVPKEPVNDPEIRRLAIKVEDHPLSYIHFEGTIPPGNYGAGTVMVWDHGHYFLGEEKNLPEADEMYKKIARGALKLFFLGQKIRGFFNLVRQGSESTDQWLLMKAAGAEDDDFHHRSALTGRNMAEIAAAENGTSDGPPVGQTDIRQEVQTSLARRTRFPGFIPPMLARLTGEPVSGEGWIHEVKLDGYRLIAAKDSDGVRLYSRRGNSFTERYATLARQLESLGASYVVDGEICHLTGEHRADFHKLQNQNVDAGLLNYYIFDVLWLNGHDLTSLPLIERKRLLQVLLADSPAQLIFHEHVEGDAAAFFEEMRKRQTEGMISKTKNSAYTPGVRSKNWLKVKTIKHRDMVICGFLPAEKPVRPFKSLLCGMYRSGKLVYTGRVGTGFSEKVMAEIRTKLDTLRTEDIEIENFPGNDKVRWVAPELVCEVGFSGWTEEGLMRHPRFITLCRHKVPEEVGFEEVIEPVRATDRLRLTNLDKVFWPEEGYTKGDVLAYYRDIAPIILGYLKDRPQSLHRMPNGIGEGFFQKNVRDTVPPWVETTTVGSSQGKDITYLLCQDVDSLLYTVNLGCIELNTWSSSLPHLQQPDYMVFDLDPVEVPFATVVEVALKFKNLFDALQLPAFCKTSGSRGLHIYIPVEPQHSYRQILRFVKEIEAHVHRDIPEITSLTRNPASRRGKVYLDYLQNGRGKTMASVYSLRPHAGAPVSAPLAWNELTAELDPAAFNIETMRRRLDRHGDLWSDFFRKRADLDRILSDMPAKEGKH